jgi:hypothetical protein
MSVTVMKLEQIGLSMGQVSIGFLLLIIGIVTYYLAPAAFLYRQFELFFMILNFLLVLMIMGLTFVSMIFVPFFEKKVILNLMMCCCKRDRKLKHVISKNLDGHAKRNSKTSLMFAISLSFLIFAASSFTLIGNLLIG